VRMRPQAIRKVPPVEGAIPFRAACRSRGKSKAARTALVASGTKGNFFKRLESGFACVGVWVDGANGARGEKGRLKVFLNLIAERGCKKLEVHL
jgi:hypothetical protein